MRLLILAGQDGWHARDLLRAAESLGHTVSIADFRTLSAGVASDPQPMAGADLVLVRTMPPGSLEQVVFRMDLLHRAQARGVGVVNEPSALETCVDKYLALARLEAAGLPVPATVTCQTAEVALEAFASLGGDVVVKPLFGSEGRGMLRVSDPDLAWRTFRTLERTQAVLYMQRFIAHPGWDLRAFVLGGRVIAAMRRHGRGNWRTNVAQGGYAEAVTLGDEEDRLALAAAAAVGATVAGVDLLPGPAGEWYVPEVNAVPGWRSLAPITGRDIASEIVRHVAGTV
jgi:ribosomal protein S6--L-glutamate ligase